MSKRVVIIDILNLFLRNWYVVPTLNINGRHVGGLVGSLKSIQKIIQDTVPNIVICVWDGYGGSLKRKSRNKNYKEGRKVVRVNRAYDLVEDAEELENKIFQQSRLLEYFNNLPFIQFVFDNVEADDIISVLTKHEYFKGWQKVIVSSDKDFIQLCDKETILYRAGQNEIITIKFALEKYNIHPNNFVLARSLCGDKSDNLRGVGGIQLPTAIKRFPFLSDEKEHTISDLIEYSIEQIKTNKKSPLVYNKVVQNESLIKENYDLMNLSSTFVGYDIRSKIDYVLNNFVPEFNRTFFLQHGTSDGILEIELEALFRYAQNLVTKYQIENRNNK